MAIIKYVTSTGKSIKFTNAAPYVLKNFNEDTNIIIYDSKGMNQDGRKYLGNNFDIKEMTLDFTIVADTKEELIKNRIKVEQAFNPKLGQGTLIYEGLNFTRIIKCIPEKIPVFKENKLLLQQGLINLVAHNPFWKNEYQSKEEIALWQGDFSFDLEILENGIEFGHREPSLIVNVNNPGDVECGIKVEFKALATVINPSILNVNTQEYIKINKTMIANESITVTTGYGEKKVESNLNGVIANAFNYIDLNSTFLQLNTGDNLLRYNADENIDNLEVSIYYTPLYLGV